MFVIVGVYVGYHASQQVDGEGESHNINIDLELLDQDTRLVQILQNSELKTTL